MRHLFKNRLGPNKRSFGFITLDDPKKLIVFVHGFTGDAFDTWKAFPYLIRKEKKFNDADVVFYDYNSTTSQPNNHAVDLYDFLTMLFQSPTGRKKTLLAAKETPFEYQKIFLIGHSMGAITIRRALLEAKKTTQPWVDKTSMILFAPAHMGAIKPRVLYAEYPFPVNVLLAAGLMKFPVIDELLSDSQTIQSLIEDSKNYLIKNDGEFCKAKKVIWAENEYIVKNQNFCHDPVAVNEHGRNHKDVCKPSFGQYMHPYDILISNL